jgi:uncharacterized protein
VVHTFQFRDDFLAYDTESQALMMIDELTAECLSLYDASGSSPTAERMARVADDQDVSLADVGQVCEEIDRLREDGYLFAPRVEVELSQLYPDRPVIKSMCLHICHDCNLRCRYCFAETGDFGTGRRGMLTVETGKKAIDFLIGHSAGRHHLDIDFFGGEPLLNWPVVEELVAYCEERGRQADKDIRLTITTNAVLLDQNKIDFINQHFKNCVLSLDGRPEVQNHMRPTAGGKGSYDVVVNNIVNFVRQRGEREHYVRGTFTRENLCFFEDVKHMVDLGMEQLSMEPVVAEDGCGYEIRMEDLPTIYEEYEKLAEYNLATDFTEKAFNFFHFNIDLDGGPCLFKRLKGCGVGTEYCAVTPDGDIYPCHQFVGKTEFLMGNVHDNPLELKQTGTVDFTNLILPQKDYCEDCWAKYYCSGGCPANSYNATGSLLDQYEIGCLLMRKRMECALWLAARRMLRDQ